MNWSDVTKAPSTRMLRQFAALWLVVFGGLAAWRAWQGQQDLWTQGIAIAAVVVGGSGLIVPSLVRPVFTGWMILAFPIGWVVSRVVLGMMFLLVFAPIAVVFRLSGRDALRLKRRKGGSYWMDKPGAASSEDYLRQF